MLELQLWDRDEQKSVAILQEGQFLIQDMRFSADGHFLMVASDDGIIHIFGVVNK
jgi:hypothetical protein